MAKLIKSDGTIQEVRPALGETFTLGELQAFVGGLIEFIYLGEDEGGMLVVNEENKFLGLPYNVEASRLARPYLYWFDAGIFGDVLFCETQDAA